jgi:hypothetical protein
MISAGDPSPAYLDGFVPERHQLDWLVKVVAPTDVVHEMFFDPVAIGGAAGADATNGVLRPMSFSLTKSGSTATLQEVLWKSGRTTMEFNPSVSLAGYHPDFIVVDGSVALRLDFDDGAEVVDGTKRTLTWNVCTPTVEEGRLPMRSISRSGQGLTGITNDSWCN